MKSLTLGHLPGKHGGECLGGLEQEDTLRMGSAGKAHRKGWASSSLLCRQSRGRTDRGSQGFRRERLGLSGFVLFVQAWLHRGTVVGPGDTQAVGLLVAMSVCGEGTEPSKWALFLSK